MAKPPTSPPHEDDQLPDPENPAAGDKAARQDPETEPGAAPEPEELDDPFAWTEDPASGDAETEADAGAQMAAPPEAESNPNSGDAAPPPPAEPTMTDEGKPDPSEPSSPSPVPPVDEAEDERTIFLPAGITAAPTEQPPSPPPAEPTIPPAPLPPEQDPAEAERTVFMPPPSAPATTTASPAAPVPPLPATGGTARTAAPFPAYTQPPMAGAGPIDPNASLGVGDVLNGIYMIDRFIARGGMGEVFEGYNIHHPEERVAIKLMLPQMAQDETGAAMFVKEATTLSKIQHEYLVQYRLAARDPQGRPFIVTEYVPGPSLEKRLGGEPLTTKQLLALWRKLAQGLGAAHDFGAIHRDIAPDNILLHSGNIYRPKIIDFGIAKDLDTAKGTIVGDGFAGKLRYVAPEQLGDHARDIGPWTDLYSLALVMLAVATGKDADMGGSIRDAVMKRTRIPDLTGVPAELHPLFQAALEPEIAKRPRTMADMIALIDKAAQQPGIGADGADAAASDKASKAPKPKAKDGSAKPAGNLIKRADGSTNWPVVGGGIAAAAVLALVLIVVLATSGGPDLPEAAPLADSADPAAPQQAALSLEEAASQAALVPDCSWLALAEAQGNRALYTGGTAKAVAAQNALGSFLASAGHQNVVLDTSQVVTFPESFCPALAAFSEFRSPMPLARTPRSSYEMEMRSPMGRPNEQQLLALPVWEITNLKPDDDFLLFSIDQQGKFFVFARGRRDIEKFVRDFGGAVNSDGIRISWDVEDKGSYGLGVIAGKGDFPLDVLPAGGEQIPTTAEWARKFRQIAAERGWRVDILWYRVTNDVPD